MRVSRARPYRLTGSAFHDPSALQNRDAVADGSHRVQVVGI